ncbi:MAG: bifunctional proline dehydrogenase/L-glutamate gamma-semialdehyde dehydrogenase PutA [Pseudomonadota bacterium]
MGSQQELREKINSCYRRGEAEIVADLQPNLGILQTMQNTIEARARELVCKIRNQGSKSSLVSQLMHRYRLSTPEGLALMCLAEALLRTPDPFTADLLIADKLTQADWASILSDSSESLWVRSSGTLLKWASHSLTPKRDHLLTRILLQGSRFTIRHAMHQGMRTIAAQFILGATMKQAHKKARKYLKRGYCFSYDMLGEAAMTAADAKRYFNAYRQAILDNAAQAVSNEIYQNPGISVKLSALHPRYEYAQRERVLQELVPKLTELAILSRANGISLTVDAEEADLLDLSLDVYGAVCRNPQFRGWNGMGLAVQAYQKRSMPVIEFVTQLAIECGQRFHIRLVKGAYWDTEIKRAQENGLDGYPVFTQKSHTDLSFLACAQCLLEVRKHIYPQFATHNAHSVAAILEIAGEGGDSGFEFQRLHGMGEALYDELVDQGITCRIYAPVGSYADLLPYLVRRLLENGANSSFVYSLRDTSVPVGDIVANPIEQVQKTEGKTHPSIPLPQDLYGTERVNSKAYDLSDPAHLKMIEQALQKAKKWTAAPIVAGEESPGEQQERVSPTDCKRVIGALVPAAPEHVAQAFTSAQNAFAAWSNIAAEERAQCLERAADLLEDNLPELMALCVREVGKTIPDALAEVREAVDFCRYYAQRARKDFSAPQTLVGPTGEINKISLHGRGIFVCISPWNFPLAIFLGQVTAALVAGNTVLAKPAGPTPLIAAFAVRLLHQAGIPADVLHLLPGAARDIGASLIEDSRVAGVALTGSVQTGHLIQKSLAQKSGPIVPLIAETGGQNVMLVDSSALPEQVVQDVLTSSFQSAGQRCSALRILLIQEEIADKTCKMLAGAMQELQIGDPSQLATDVGPVINQHAKIQLEQHVEQMQRQAKLIAQTPLSESCANGTFVAPSAFEINDLSTLKQEHFGPILHILRYKANNMDALLDSVNDLGYGLTFGIHSRVESTVRRVVKRMRVGNAYVNRNMIGAVVGVQPFGGEGLSGTGPKAGGTRYLHRFATERTLCVNTTAQGGNASLLMLDQ